MPARTRETQQEHDLRQRWQYWCRTLWRTIRDLEQIDLEQDPAAYDTLLRLQHTCVDHLDELAWVDHVLLGRNYPPIGYIPCTPARKCGCCTEECIGHCPKEVHGPQR